MADSLGTDGAGSTADGPGGEKVDVPARKPYERPRILSAESLEAVAAVCFPPVQGVGKSFPAPPCTNAMGS